MCSNNEDSSSHIKRFIMDDTIAINATHIETRDQTPAKEEQKKWLQQTEHETALLVFI
jgi:transposase